jgi:hypothetical protein
MKLTKLHRQAFVTAVMQDVPQIDYETQAHKLAKECSIEYLPPQLRSFALDKELSRFLCTESTWFRHHTTGISNTMVFTDRHHSFRLKDEDQAKMDAILDAAERQIKDRNALKEKITGVIEGCTTLKSAKERLPEFEKYLPKEAEKTANLPAISNLVADLAKMGWPKDQQPVAA